MRRINYKYLVLIFAIAVFLDLLSTHLNATLFSEQGLSLLEIASRENNPIISYFWIKTNSIVLGEMLDFAVKVGVGSIIIISLTKWNKFPSYPDSLLFFFFLGGSWVFFFNGFISNILFYRGYGSGYSFEILGYIGYFIIGIIGIILAMRAKRGKKKHAIKLEQ